MAHLIGDGSFVKRQPIRYASQDEACLDTVASAAWHRFGITAKRDDYPAARCITLRLPAPYHLTHGKRNPIAEWLDGMGLFGLRSHEKFVPDWVFGLPKEQVALFLRNLWATDGSVSLSGGKGNIYYGTTSRRLADDVARLLLRFNVFTRLYSYTKGEYRPGYQVHVTGAENQIRFLDDVGVWGSRETKATALSEFLVNAKGRSQSDTIPVDVWHRVRDVINARNLDVDDLTGPLQVKSLPRLFAKAPTRQTMLRVATILGEEDLEVLATNDILWDEVKSIESVGLQDVYDATVLGVHNFVAEGIALHNSLEQDADMVILLHRDDVYERESTRPGEADLIVAKHRNGQTRDITVAFQGHYSRFVDMAH